MLKLLFAVVAAIAAVMIAGVYFSFNPAIPIFIILGLGLYGVRRIGGPALPADAPFVGRRRIRHLYACQGLCAEPE